MEMGLVTTGKDASTVRFTYDGTRIEKGDTPKELDMEDNDTIEVHIEQVRLSFYVSLPKGQTLMGVPRSVGNYEAKHLRLFSLSLLACVSL